MIIASSSMYVWAVGGALFFQPPQIFRLTALLFSNQANDLEFLNLELPYQCRQLVSVSNGSCSCKSNRLQEPGSTITYNILAMLTEQVQDIPN